VSKPGSRTRTLVVKLNTRSRSGAKQFSQTLGYPDAQIGKSDGQMTLSIQVPADEVASRKRALLDLHLVQSVQSKKGR